MKKKATSWNDYSFVSYELAHHNKDSPRRHYVNNLGISDPYVGVLSMVTPTKQTNNHKMLEIGKWIAERLNLKPFLCLIEIKEIVTECS